jgi:hypothetical protein
VTGVAVVLLDRQGQVLAGEELIFGNEAVKAFPIIRYERVVFDPDFVEALLTGCIITPSQNPG